MSTIVDKVMLAGGDLSALSVDEKVQFIDLMKKQSGLEKMVMPFSILKLDSKEMLYAPKGTTDELRRMHNLSFDDIRYETTGKTVMCHVMITDGKRRDFDCGVVSIEGLDAAGCANAQMAATTKAKRRATLSFCGLGMIDESEFDTIQKQMTTSEIAETGLQIDKGKIAASQKMTEEASKLNSDQETEKPKENIFQQKNREREEKEKEAIAKAESPPADETPASNKEVPPQSVVDGLNPATVDPKELLKILEAWFAENVENDVNTMWTDDHKRIPRHVKAVLKAIDDTTILVYCKEHVGIDLTFKGDGVVSANPEPEAKPNFFQEKLEEKAKKEINIREPIGMDISFLTEPGTTGRDMIQRMKLAELCAFKEGEIVEDFKEQFPDIEAFYKFATVADVKKALEIEDVA